LNGLCKLIGMEFYPIRMPTPKFATEPFGVCGARPTEPPAQKAFEAGGRYREHYRDFHRDADSIRIVQIEAARAPSAPRKEACQRLQTGNETWRSRSYGQPSALGTSAVL
jgi:hypothetical protein